MPTLPEPPRQTKLSVLAPAFQVRLVEGLRECHRAGLKVYPFETLRTNERQAWLYSSGRTRKGYIVTNAKTAETSLHGWGLACDIAFKDPTGAWWWPDSEGEERELWNQAHRILVAAGLELGPKWDLPHIQGSGVPQSLPASVRKGRSCANLADRIAMWSHYDQIQAHYWDSHAPW